MTFPNRCCVTCRARWPSGSRSSPAAGEIRAAKSTSESRLLSSALLTFGRVAERARSTSPGASRVLNSVAKLTGKAGAPGAVRIYDHRPGGLPAPGPSMDRNLSMSRSPSPAQYVIGPVNPSLAQHKLAVSGKHPPQSARHFVLQTLQFGISCRTKCRDRKSTL